MGADFNFLTVPKCDLKKGDRLSQVKKLVEEIHEEEIRNEVKDALKQYPGLSTNREVGVISLPGCTCQHYITGGMDWGDDPTAIYPVFEALLQSDSVYEILEKFAVEDGK